MSEGKTDSGAAGNAAAPAADTGPDAEVLQGEVVDAEESAPSNDGAAGADGAAPAESAVADAEPADSDADGTSAATQTETADAAAEDVEADISALEDTRRERDEYLELAQRTRADFENFRKRAAGEAAAARVRGKAELASDLVGVLDNLERALQAASVDPKAALAGEVSPEGPLEQGIVLTYRELHAVLQRGGVEAFDPAGEKFDPTWHEVLQTRAEEGTESGTVVETLQKGYRIGDQLIRASRVVVSA